MANVKLIKNAKHTSVFDVQNLAPKNAVALNAAMEFDVETMRIHTVNIQPQTNTVMDPKQWAQRAGQIPLDSRFAKDFARVTDCGCDSGGPCCGAELQLKITNEHISESLKVYTDDIVSSDPRVRPVHRTFFVLNATSEASGVRVETSEAHTFSEGDLVNVLDGFCGLPSFVKAKDCSPTGLTLVPLFPDEKFGVLAIPSVSATRKAIGRISNRQLLYVLAPGQTVAWTATATKGSGRDWVKWSPCWSFYRPLFRDNKIDRNVNLTADQARGLVESCPKRVFDIEWIHNVLIARPDDCDACRQCEDWAKDNGVPGVVQLTRRKKPEWQRFTVHSNGSMDSIPIVDRALDIIVARLRAVAGAAEAQLSYPSLPSNQNRRR